MLLKSAESYKRDHENRDKKDHDRRKWKRYFAWFPVYLSDTREKVIFEMVYRRHNPNRPRPPGAKQDPYGYKYDDNIWEYAHAPSVMALKDPSYSDDSSDEEGYGGFDSDVTWKETTIPLQSRSYTAGKVTTRP